ncbi:WYL domain-containing protein [Kosakonia oryziphila]|jgi:Predicted transcriptional regulator|uniref:Predicted DNA-binding transcriptional regulator YafY, contains an HTH and WYL domains n=1 Tax=Kosakonia oryziphila TaxID=1005667 RepID=A0A1C4C901_9ENTR|nr:WYL domain-containing protein [Kosakonia oryziphila]SCC15454.1 Predicted DNA-binding transcriptional regulator YafY, contains an HTH and WYL domains [Kosakonia oryziphila]
MKESHDRKHDSLIERLCEIFAALYQGKTIDKAWLCDKFSITERTAYRDLARLGHILDQVSPGRYKLSAHLLPTLHSGHLAEFAGFTSMTHLFPRQDGQLLRNSMKQRSNIADSRQNLLPEPLLNQLNQAISQRIEVEYCYRDKARRAQPYRLINQYGLWYLAAVEKGQLKAFEVARIERLTSTDQHFELHARVVAELDSHVGIRFGSRVETVLSVSAHAAEYVTRRALFPAQRIIEHHDDGSLTLSTAISDPHTLFRWLRYWLPDIGILSPASLREQFEQDLYTRFHAV